MQQHALRDLDQAWRNFFDGTHRRPSWRKRGKHEGFRVTGRDWNVRRLNRRWGQVKVPKIGYVRFRWTRAVPECKSYRVTRDRCGRYIVPGPAARTGPPAHGREVGVDRGVRTALVTSDGQHYRAPRISDRRAARYLALRQRMARQCKGQVKREKTRRAMAHLAARVTDRRRDWAEKVSTRLVMDHDLIVFEQLNTKGMVRKPKPKPDPDKPAAYLHNRAAQKAGLNRGILASAWGTLATRTQQKAEASGAAVVYVDPRFTSQQCRACGHTARDNRDSQACFLCVECGHADHADANAARNILARGLAFTGVPAQAPGPWGVRPRQPAQAAAGTTRSAA